MRPRRIWICTILGCDPYWTSMRYCLHEFRNCGYILDWEPDNVDILLAVFPSLQLLPVIEKVKQFPTVDFEKWHRDTQIGVHAVSNTENVLGPKIVHARTAALQVSVHGVGLSAACLSIGKTGNLGPQKSTMHYGLHTLVVELLVINFLAECAVEFEHMLLDVLGEVDFESRDKGVGTCAHERGCRCHRSPQLHQSRSWLAIFC